MTQRTDLTRGRDIVARWCVLAEQRLEYLTELFETGRWRRYHSEEAFLENIREAKAAVETWQDLLTREATLGNSPIDISWLGRSGVIAPPITWDEGGEQYVAVVSGWGGAVPLWGGDVAKRVNMLEQGGSVWVFKLHKS